MGLFSKIKNSMTGGWCEVDLDISDAVRGGTAQGVVTVRMKDEPISVDEIYVNIRCNECVRLNNYKVTVRDRDDPGDYDRHSIDIDEDERLLDDKIVAEGECELGGGETRTFEFEFDVPEGMPPSYHGRNASVEWVAFAGLDMKGNDPDSGWVKFNVT
jgi:hypothetical protein